jgi:hypothetical protein
MNPVVATFFLLASVGIFFGYIRPAWLGTIQTAQAEINAFDEAITAGKGFVDRQNKLLAERNAIREEDLARLQEFLPDNVDNVKLILEIDRIATRNGIQIRNIAISEEAPVAENAGTLNTVDTRPYGTLLLSFTAVASYPGFLQFLTELEQSLRLIDIVDISFPSSQTGVYNYNLSLRMYWLR